MTAIYFSTSFFWWTTWFSHA